jgi:spermidine/putrescine transport system permease protein
MYSRGYKSAVTIPPVLWVGVFLVVPYLLLFVFSFWQVRSQTIVHDWTLANYRTILQNPLYLTVLGRSIRIAASVTCLSVLLAFPMAYFISFRLRRGKDLIYQLVIIPLWVSYLVRAYAWKTILGSDGVLNKILEFSGLVQHPVGFLLYSPFAVIVTLTHIYTPFAFLPIYAAMAHIPRPLLEASSDLGASPVRSFWTVVFPLAVPGALAGATFAFVLSLGDFLSPLLIGGSSGIMISNVVVSLFGAAYDWPLGAALSFVMLALVVALISAAERLSKRLSAHGL